jgi:hypothetical protein
VACAYGDSNAVLPLQGPEIPDSFRRRQLIGQFERKSRQDSALGSCAEFQFCNNNCHVEAPRLLVYILGEVFNSI